MVSLQKCLKMEHKKVPVDYGFSPREEGLECVVTLESSPRLPMLIVETTCTQKCHQLECTDFASISL